MSRLLQWLVRRVGATTLCILLLLAIGLASLVWTLSAAVRGLDLDLLVTLMVVGSVSGWLLARSRVRWSIAALLLLLIAFVAAFVRVGQLGERLFAIIDAVGHTLWGAQYGQFHTQMLSQAASSLLAASLTLVTRVQGWSNALVSGQPVYEPVALALVWSVVVCLVAAWAAWQVRRGERAFVGFLPITILLGLVGAYSGRGLWAMFALLAAWFGLLVIVPYLARQRRWERDNVPFAESLGFDLAFIAVPVIFGILILAVSVPVLSPQELARRVREWSDSAPVASQAISDSFGIQAAPRPPTALDNISSPGLPRSHLLGAGPDLLKTLALTVQLDGATREIPVQYWLGTTYDEYTGRGWFSSGFQERDYRAGESISDRVPPADHILHETVRVENAPGIIYAAGQLQSADQSFQVAWRQPGDMFGAQLASNSYRVDSYVPGFDADALRAAGQVYPEWIRSQYLRVPEEMPPRVLALARDLTATEPTPYDRARALETYLRTFPYSLDVPLPPVNHDVVDYFLFDLRRGYCDYYSTAMAMLARAAGLPARVAVGYASGTYDAATHTYRVTEADAHSWTQIYFPNYGWVDFEPTSGHAPASFDAANAHPPAPPDFSAPNSNSFPAYASRTLEQYWFVAPTMLLFVSLLVLGSLFADTLILRRTAPTKMVTLLYHRMVRFARLIGVPISPGLTPNQIQVLVENALAAPADSRSWRLRRPVLVLFHLIVARYVKMTYGAKAVSDTEAAQLIRKWEAARLQIALVLLLNVLQTQANSLSHLINKQFSNLSRTLIRGKS